MKKLIVLLSFFLLSACGDKHLSLDRSPKVANGGAKPHGPEAAVTFDRDIKPIFARACQACHNEASAIPDWGNYDISFSKKDRLLDRVIIKKDMPLGIPITDDERNLIGEWLKLGAPKGGDSAPAAETAPVPEAPPTPEPSPAPEVQPHPEPAPEPVAPPAPEPAPAPVLESEVLTYAQVKAKVFDPYCALCHNENSGDFMPNWGSFQITSSRKDRIYTRVVLEKNMPPEGMPFNEEAREMLKKWIEEGAVE